MKTSIKSNQAPIVLFWSVPSISQIKSYKRNCELLVEATTQLKSVEVTTNSNGKEKFNAIELEADIFYGLKKIKGELIRVFLNVNKIKTVVLL